MQRTVDDLIAIMRAVDNSATSKCGFDMIHGALSRTASGHPCGTACCIGGHAYLAVYGESYVWCSSLAGAVTKFGVDANDADRVCYPDTGTSGWNAKPEHAVRLLEIYRDEGVVDWDRAMALTD